MESPLELDGHIRKEVGCDQSSSDLEIEGVTAEQHLKLRKRTPFKLASSEEEKWMVVWEILFPGELRPASPCELTSSIS